MSRPPARRLPARPLLDHLEARADLPARCVFGAVPEAFSSQMAAVELETTSRSVKRWKVDGIPESTADRLAVAAGVQPELLWPDLVDRDDLQLLPPADSLRVPLTCPVCGLGLHADGEHHGDGWERSIDLWCPECGDLTVTVRIDRPAIRGPLGLGKETP